MTSYLDVILHNSIIIYTLTHIFSPLLSEQNFLAEIFLFFAAFHSLGEKREEEQEKAKRESEKISKSIVVRAREQLFSLRLSFRSVT